MTQSPKKYVSTFTSSTTNRGVEAKEIEIGNIQLDTSSQYQESSDAENRSQASGDTGSYLQVVVQKHKKKEPTAAATQTSPRLPISSSPLKPKNGPVDHQVYLLQQPMLLAYSNAQKNLENNEQRKKLPIVKEEVTRSFWSKFKESTKDSPDKLDVYYFERTNGDFLASSDGTFTYTERFASQISRVPNRVVAEFFSIPQIVAGVPVAIFLIVERSIFLIFRSIIVGSVQIWSDYFLKPILTLAFNAVIQPPLVFTGNVGRAIRDAARPIADILGDFLAPVVKVLSAIRLVNVEKSVSHNV